MRKLKSILFGLIATFLVVGTVFAYIIWTETQTTDVMEPISVDTTEDLSLMMAPGETDTITVTLTNTSSVDQDVSISATPNAYLTASLVSGIVTVPAKDGIINGTLAVDVTITALPGTTAAVSGILGEGSVLLSVDR